MRLVALDDGHGMGTPGKRSPASLGLPILRENEFNRDVVSRIAILLGRNGIGSMYTAPTDADTPLKARVAAAHAAGCKIFVSIHANAGGGTGLETWYATGSDSGERLARLIQAETVRLTGQVDRGRKAGSFYVIKQSAKLGMAAALFEGGFMDNAEDLALLRTDKYRQQCAEGVARAVCLYVGVPYK